MSTQKPRSLISIRLRTESKQMSEDGECLQIRIKETQLERLLIESSRQHEKMVKSKSENWTVILQRRLQEQPLTDRHYANDRMTFRVPQMVT